MVAQNDNNLDVAICVQYSVTACLPNGFNEPPGLNYKCASLIDHSYFSPIAVFFPTTPGTYAPVLFVPGVFTFVVTELYSTVLAHFASYGYIVFGVDLFWPLAGQEKWRERSRESVPEEHEYEKMFDVINWV